MPQFGELRRVDLRELWPREAADFTPWLAENLDSLGAALGLELELIEREAPVGEFSCDLVVRDLGSNRLVIIENQLDSTNHDHLGKLLTYAAGREARVLIWVAREIRDEHRQALVWLNERTDVDTDFFGVVVEAIRIDNSLPAFNFKLLALPNQWQKQVAEASKASLSPKESRYREFFQQLIDELREQHRFTSSRKSQPQNWFTFSSGVAGFQYGASFAQGGRVRIDLYIDFYDVSRNKLLFDALSSEKTAIEIAYGQPLAWERLEDRRASRVAIYREGSIDFEDEKLGTIRAWCVQELLRFKQVFGPLLKPHLDRISLL